VLEVGEYEGGLCELADAAGAGGDVAEDAPAADEQGEASLSIPAAAPRPFPRAAQPSWKAHRWPTSSCGGSTTWAISGAGNSAQPAVARTDYNSRSGSVARSAPGAPKATIAGCGRLSVEPGVFNEVDLHKALHPSGDHLLSWYMGSDRRERWSPVTV
jgi:hypothetical protein